MKTQHFAGQSLLISLCLLVIRLLVFSPLVIIVLPGRAGRERHLAESTPIWVVVFSPLVIIVLPCRMGRERHLAESTQMQLLVFSPL